MAQVDVSELLPSEALASAEVRRLIDGRDLETWLAADLEDRIALAAREGGRLVGILLGGARGETSCVTHFSLHPMAGAPVAVAFTLIGALRRRLGPVAFERCAFALRRADLDVRQALATFGARAEEPDFFVEALPPAPAQVALP